MFSAHYVRIQRFCEKYKSYNILPLSLYFHFHDEMLIGFLDYTQV